ncbi:hypothetical protein C5L14_21110 [Labrys okinawensis]|uniref:Uncharacterized protein n=1 Tax=Labrys okinawensis TaxID=346911 RepID=A0A2S9Q853_9HYPH|nr:hypothetical protein C5L14_21110 [Labrys okinawensis]
MMTATKMTDLVRDQSADFPVICDFWDILEYDNQISIVDTPQGIIPYWSSLRKNQTILIGKTS